MRPETFCLETTYSSPNLKASIFFVKTYPLWSLDINPCRPPRLPIKDVCLYPAPFKNPVGVILHVYLIHEGRIPQHIHRLRRQDLD
jgi:hypothetical protein